MAQVMVFVDDAVRGDLPDLCAKDGVPTTDRLRIRQPIGDRTGLGVALLLLLAGPIGWVGLLVVSMLRGGRAEALTVELPVGEAAYERLRAARRMRGNAVTIAAIAGATAVAALYAGAAVGPSQALLLLLAAVLIGSVVTALVADARMQRSTVGVGLDASRRWVTLSRVHPDFVAACESRERDGQRS